MTEDKYIILYREDLRKAALDLPIEEIQPYDFSSVLDYKKLAQSSMIIFIDDQGEYKILKSRYFSP